jgi:hypothetical protein
VVPSFSTYYKIFFWKSAFFTHKRKLAIGKDTMRELQQDSRLLGINLRFEVVQLRYSFRSDVVTNQVNYNLIYSLAEPGR